MTAGLSPRFTRGLLDCELRYCSGYFDTHHNVLVYKAIDAAYGGASLKSDFGGHSNHHHHNIDLFFSKGFSICSQLQASVMSPAFSSSLTRVVQGFEDQYYRFA
jgi:hypothetical protein